MSLASLTQAAHQNAERQEFASKMMSGKMSEEKYKTYLYNMWLVYDILEDVALSMGCFGPEDLSMPDDDLPLDGLTQADDIWADYTELGGTEENPPQVVPSTEAYRSHIVKNCQHDKEKLFAHIYVRHMGDLSGGQIIANKLKDKFPTKFYEFSEDPEVLKDKLKAKLNNDMADEAMLAFDYANKIFLELDQSDDLG